MMTKNELLEALKALESKRFMLAMKDRWNSKDYDTDRRWEQEERKLRAQLAQM